MITDTLPRLSAVGHELDLSPDAIGSLRDSSDIADACCMKGA